VIAANSDILFTRLCEVMAMPELATDERFSSHVARGRNQDEIDAVVAAWALLRDAAEIDELLNSAGVICGPIYTIADIFEDPQVQAREMLVECEDPEFGHYLGPGVIPKLSATPGSVRWSATWKPGSHNDEIYAGLLGLSEGELACLEKEGVI
jgi:formyl-CoA transferase